MRSFQGSAVVNVWLRCVASGLRGVGLLVVHCEELQEGAWIWIVLLGSFVGCGWSVPFAEEFRFYP